MQVKTSFPGVGISSLVLMAKYAEPLQRLRRAEFQPPPALARLRASFEAVCRDFEAELVEFNGEADHVRLLVNYPPKVAIARLVNSLKGVSARRLRRERPDIASRYWRGRLWSASYFAASCGDAPIAALRQFIEEQRRRRCSPP